MVLVRDGGRPGTPTLVATPGRRRPPPTHHDPPAHVGVPEGPGDVLGDRGPELGSEQELRQGDDTVVVECPDRSVTHLGECPPATGTPGSVDDVLPPPRNTRRSGTEVVDVPPPPTRRPSTEVTDAPPPPRGVTDRHPSPCAEVIDGPPPPSGVTGLHPSLWCGGYRCSFTHPSGHRPTRQPPDRRIHDPHPNRCGTSDLRHPRSPSTGDPGGSCG